MIPSTIDRRRRERFFQRHNGLFVTFARKVADARWDAETRELVIEIEHIQGEVFATVTIEYDRMRRRDPQAFAHLSDSQILARLMTAARHAIVRVVEDAITASRRIEFIPAGICVASDLC